MTALAEMEQAWEDAPSVPTTLYEARALMLQLQTLDREQAEQDDLFHLIQEDYSRASSTREQRRGLIRQALLAYVQTHGKAVIPDVGTAHAQTRKPHVVIVDDQTAVKVARELDPEGTDGLWKPVVSRTGMKQRAQKHLDETGEILPGCELQPAATSLVIKPK